MMGMTRAKVERSRKGAYRRSRGLLLVAAAGLFASGCGGQGGEDDDGGASDGGASVGGTGGMGGAESTGGTVGTGGDPLLWEDAHPPFTDESVAAARAALLETDLSVAAALQPTPTPVGGPSVLTVEVANAGPNAASRGSVELSFPVGTTVVSAPSVCERLATRVWRCSTALDRGFDKFPMPTGTNKSFTFDLQFAANETGGNREVLIATGHEGEELTPRDSSTTVSVRTMPSFLGFDDGDRPWVESDGDGEIIPTTDADDDLALSLPCGQTQFESPTFDTAELEVVGERLAVDVFVPAALAAEDVGDLQLFLQIPSAQLSIGRVDLVDLDVGAWSVAEFQLSSDQVDILLEDHPDARLRFASNVASCEEAVLLNSLRFTGERWLRPIFHPADQLPVTSSSVLTFDEPTDWQMTSGAGAIAQQTSDITQGSAALDVSVEGWIWLQSEEFEVSELEDVSAQLAFDVHIPDLPLDYYWLGEMNVFLSCPDRGIYNSYLGHQPLQLLSDDEYNQVRFDLSSEVQAVLGAGAASCRFAIELSADEELGAFSLDNGGFVQ